MKRTKTISVLATILTASMLLFTACGTQNDANSAIDSANTSSTNEVIEDATSNGDAASGKSGEDSEEELFDGEEIKEKETQCKTAPDFAWRYENGTLYISGHGEMPKFERGVIGGYLLTPWPKGSTIEAVVIEDGITNIPGELFLNCENLKSITVPDSVTKIGHWAFYNTAWYNSQPDGIVYIGKVAYSVKGILPEGSELKIKDGTVSVSDEIFFSCENLKSLIIPEGVTYIGGSDFMYDADCDKIENIVFPDSIVRIDSAVISDTAWFKNQPDGLVYAGKVALKQKGKMPENTKITLKPGTVSIAPECFSGCSGLAETEIPDSVENIGHHAFYECVNLKEIEIPHGVSKIPHDAFGECKNLAEIVFPSTLTYVDAGAFDGTAWYNGQPDGVVYAGRAAYKWKGDMPENTEVKIKKGAVSITGGCFDGCEKLIKITIPAGVKYLGDSRGDFFDGGCFSNTGITEITLPDGLNMIGRYAFGNCKKLKSVIIPDSVTNINSGAFGQCEKLEEITLPNKTGYICSNMFENCASLSKVVLPKGLKVIDRFAFSGCGKLCDIEIPDGVTAIAQSAFESCESLEKINIPDGIGVIGGSAFWECKSLESIVIPASAEYIGSQAFYNCENMKSIRMRGEVKYIADDAFEGCSWYENYTEQTSGNVLYFNGVAQKWQGDMAENTSVIIENGTTAIGNNCFEGYENLVSVILPDGLTKIGDYSFRNCTSLKSITFPDSVSDIGGSAFSGCIALKEVKLSAKMKKIESGTFEKCESLENIVIPEGITEIGNIAFDGCKKLKSITIPKSVISIGSMKNIRGGETLECGWGAFGGCESLTDVYYAGSESDWAKIDIVDYDNPFTNATVHFNYGE